MCVCGRLETENDPDGLFHASLKRSTNASVYGEIDCLRWRWWCGCCFRCGSVHAAEHVQHESGFLLLFILCVCMASTANAYLARILLQICLREKLRCCLVSHLIIPVDRQAARRATVCARAHAWDRVVQQSSLGPSADLMINEIVFLLLRQWRY